MVNGITINAFKKFEFLNKHHWTSLAEYGFYIYNNYCRFKVFCNKGLKIWMFLAKYLTENFDKSKKLEYYYCYVYFSNLSFQNAVQLFISTLVNIYALFF